MLGSSRLAEIAGPGAVRSMRARAKSFRPEGDSRHMSPARRLNSEADVASPLVRGRSASNAIAKRMDQGRRQH